VPIPGGGDGRVIGTAQIILAVNGGHDGIGGVSQVTTLS
jgi:hypothetical protein